MRLPYESPSISSATSSALVALTEDPSEVDYSSERTHCKTQGTREIKISSQPCCMNFRGKPCYATCQRCYTEKAMLDLAVQEVASLMANPFVQTRSIGLIPTSSCKLANIPPNAQASKPQGNDPQRTMQRPTSDHRQPDQRPFQDSRQTQQRQGPPRQTKGLT
jgi:hypothetical protein